MYPCKIYETDIVHVRYCLADVYAKESRTENDVPVYLYWEEVINIPSVAELSILTSATDFSASDTALINKDLLACKDFGTLDLCEKKWYALWKRAYI